VSNSTIINSSGIPITGATGGFYIAPVRNDTGPSFLYYNDLTKEITHNNIFQYKQVSGLSIPVTYPGVPPEGANITIDYVILGKQVTLQIRPLPIPLPTFSDPGSFSGNGAIPSEIRPASISPEPSYVQGAIAVINNGTLKPGVITIYNNGNYSINVLNGTQLDGNFTGSDNGWNNIEFTYTILPP
jgi:hypothetical protein